MATQTLNYGHAYNILNHSEANNALRIKVQALASESITSQYLVVAMLTVLVYHTLTTMDKEIKYFWSKPASPVSLIYFSNRCVGLLGIICGELSQALKWTTGLCNLITIVLLDYILQIRVLALYQQNRRLSICLKVLLTIDAAIGLGIFVYGTLVEDITVGQLVPTMTFCAFARHAPQLLLTISWTVPLIYGMILLFLALFKAAQYWIMSSGFQGFHLVRVLIEDQALYYSFVIFCSVSQILQIQFDGINHFVAIVLAAIGSPTLLCILGSHLLINLKEAGERGVNEGTNYRSRTVSDIEFAEGAPAAVGSNEKGTASAAAFDEA